ncbi:MAG: patatin-like phospholipase family protein [Clostridiaceae bacterium]|nr:patatin-like phospholipase family protein [Clostridiaceae bacterium]
MKADVIFEGGGIKGIGFVGAVVYLENQGFSWEKLAGTSAGSIVAALLAVGYSGKELKDLLLSLKYKNLLGVSSLKTIPFFGVKNYFSLFKRWGIYTGDELESWIEDLLQKKGKTKFKDLYVNGESRLKIIASDITNRDILILPDDLVNYGIDPLEFKISKAVRMSISIPIFFRPVILKYKNKLSYVVDGGIISNFPIWIFDTDRTPRWPTFGFKLKENSLSNTALGKKDIISYLIDIVDTVVDKKEERYFPLKDRVRTIEIQTLGVKTTEFNISTEKSVELFNSGYKSARDFYNSWNFNEYIKKYRG